MMQFGIGFVSALIFVVLFWIWQAIPQRDRLPVVFQLALMLIIGIAIGWGIK